MQTINGGNYYHEKAFNEICEALEQGQTISVYIDCIGHGTNNREQEVYKEELLNKFGSRLMVERSEGGYSYSYTYKLKYLATGGK